MAMKSMIVKNSFFMFIGDFDKYERVNNEIMASMVIERVRSLYEEGMKGSVTSNCLNKVWVIFRSWV